MSLNRRQLRFENWDQVMADIEHLDRTGYQHARNGNWSLGQICEHLAKILEAAVGSESKVMMWPIPWILRNVFLKKMLRHQATSLRVKVPLAFAPRAELTDEEGIERLRAAVLKFVSHPGDYAPHPAFGMLPRNQWEHQQYWHCEHHLSFLIPKHEIDVSSVK
ncbi:MAG: DUF1569 domain-containing protein [Planctomycetales bacterium]|nr:DUF1569 domain-containing protein [Planctomycetales bacterium]